MLPDGTQGLLKLNVKMIIAYDGTCYLGWQKTRMGMSIEEVLQECLEKILQEKISLQAASRTDAGVHAEGQVVNFFTTKKISNERLKLSLNSLLPKDIAILHVENASADFHPTLDCIGKEYHYHLCFGSVQYPRHRFYSWHFPQELNADNMRQAAASLIGEHDFSAFCNFKKNAAYSNYIRQIQDIEILELPQKRLCIKIRGNHFLYKMARNIAGTLVYVGCGKLSLEDLPEILGSKKRTLAGMTAPAHGLALHKVLFQEFREIK